MSKEIEPIDFVAIARKIWKRKKTFLYTLPTVFILAYLYIVSIPRYYMSEVRLAPEMTSTSLSGLSSLASSFGIDMASKMGQNQDAISPELYPDLMESMDFRVSLFPIKVKTLEGHQNTYYAYMKSEQKAPWWSAAIGSLKSRFSAQDTSRFSGTYVPDAFRLTKTQHDIVDAIGRKVQCTVDKKTSVISIRVEDQDPLVAATLADSVRARLQSFITSYRTKKARNDLEYVKGMLREAKARYEQARQRYGAFSDANTDIMLTSYKLKENDLENDMQLLYNNYSALATQLHTAEAKVQERTPAFTTLQSATVAVKPAGPKRMVFVLTMMFLAFLGTSLYILVRSE